LNELGLSTARHVTMSLHPLLLHGVSTSMWLLVRRLASLANQAQANQQFFVVSQVTSQLLLEMFA
jgi:hypothetical protein